MEDNRLSSFKRRSNPLSEKGGNRRGKFGDQFSENPQASETVYRILCQSRKIGSVIAKGGGIVKALREETRAKITIADSVPGSDHRVFVIYSPLTKKPVKRNADGDSEDMGLEKNDMELQCAAQDALLKVHDRIVEEDGGTDNGDVIQRLRSETGANIHVLPADQLPVCAVNTDALVQVNQILQRGLLMKFLPCCIKIHERTNLLLDSLPAAKWRGGYVSENSRFGPAEFDGDYAVARGGEVRAEFAMKILCPTAKIGGVIADSDEHVIRVSAIEALWNPRSRTIDAILFLQDKTSDHSEIGIITSRLLIPSSKVGCILGQGGQLINEMRTKADIRVYSKEEKPKCAGEDEELVQVRLHQDIEARSLRDAKPGAEPAPAISSRGNLDVET
ncbi:K Homology domain-containing protein [Cynara cardunculus var. scolymus]|uniref:K Homology domain-containing protein n=1 Tax=Cynara cardunculus var. scolymus TaxID=59895 RepID=A0A103Y5B7_CYNCS|nr:K Homology domain-containing protein [Cynara cardunculus var. scolymus]